MYEEVWERVSMGGDKWQEIRRRGKEGERYRDREYCHRNSETDEMGEKEE